jgi:hypothetical protein
VRTELMVALVVAMLMTCRAPLAEAQAKPNIIAIFSDDVGVWNLSAYHRGLIGGRTPNIDRIANEGALFTDYYAQQRCTAGRCVHSRTASLRTGLLAVGMPGSPIGVRKEDPTIAELLKPLGCTAVRSCRSKETLGNLCRGRDSNPHGPFGPEDFKSSASAISPPRLDHLHDP